MQVEDVLIIFEHDGDGCKVIERVLVQSRFWLVIGEAGEQFPLEDDGDENVLGRGHELQLHPFLRADEEKKLHSLQILGREILKDLPDGVRFDLSNQASRLVILLQHSQIL